MIPMNFDRCYQIYIKVFSH